MDTDKTKDSAEALDVRTGSANFRDRFGTPSHPDGCLVLIAAALIRAESLLKEASEALESECESEQRDAWNDIRDYFEQNTKIRGGEHQAPHSP